MKEIHIHYEADMTLREVLLLTVRTLENEADPLNNIPVPTVTKMFRNILDRKWADERT